MPSVDLEHGRLNYEIDGRSAAPVLVLSHSLGTNLTMWEPQITPLTRLFRVLRYDSRGHGQSVVAPGPYTIELLARDLLALLDHVGANRAHFCGLSMGGMIGLWLGINEPRRLNKLVLCNTAALIGPAERWDKRIEDVRQRGLEAIAGEVLEVWFSSSFRERAPETIDHMRQMLTQTSPDGYVASCAAIRDADLRSGVSRVRVPTLVVAGARDSGTPPSAGLYIADRVERGRYVELNAAHLSNIEAPDRFTAAVTEFLMET